MRVSLALTDSRPHPTQALARKTVENLFMETQFIRQLDSRTSRHSTHSAGCFFVLSSRSTQRERKPRGKLLALITRREIPLRVVKRDLFDSAT